MDTRKRKRTGSNPKLERLLSHVENANNSADLATLNQNLAALNQYLAGSEDLAELSSEERAGKLHDQCRKNIKGILNDIAVCSEIHTQSIKIYIQRKLDGKEHVVMEEALGQLITQGTETCTSFAAILDVRQAMMRLYEDRLALKQYRVFNGTLSNYEGNRDDVVAALSLLVTPVTRILKPPTPAGTFLFYADMCPGWLIATLMAEKIGNVSNSGKVLREAPDFVSDFEKSTENHDDSPLTANEPSKVLWERAQHTKSIDQILEKILQIVSTFTQEVQQCWDEETFEDEYGEKLHLLYETIIDTVNCILPPSVHLSWGAKRNDPDWGMLDGYMRTEVLVSMEYKVRDGKTKTIKQPIYSADYKHVNSLISLGIAAVDGTLEDILQHSETLVNDCKKYDGPSIVQWDDPKSRANACGGGLRNANKAVRRAVLTPVLENYFERLRDSSNTINAANSKFGKLACVTAVGIGDGCSHSMALISRRKEDFEGSWSNLKYIPDEEEDYKAPPALCEAEGMSGNISKFYELFQHLEQKNKDGPTRPRLVFSDYMHMNDDESFVFRVVRALVNLVSMNIVVMYWLRGFCPDDGLDEDNNNVHEYINHLTNALGDKFKEDYSDVFSGNNTDNEPCGNHSLDRDNGLVYRYILQAKSKFQSVFMEWLRAQNTSKWKLEEEQLRSLPPEYQDKLPDVLGRRTFRDDDGSFRYLIEIRLDTVLGIYNELESYCRLQWNHEQLKVAPRFLGFGFYSYKNVGVELYKFCIHVEGVKGVNGRDCFDINCIIRALERDLSTQYAIEHRYLPEKDVMINDNRVLCINFKDVQFTDDDSNDESYEDATLKLIYLLNSTTPARPSSSSSSSSGNASQPA